MDIDKILQECLNEIKDIKKDIKKMLDKDKHPQDRMYYLGSRYKLNGTKKIYILARVERARDGSDNSLAALINMENGIPYYRYPRKVCLNADRITYQEFKDIGYNEDDWTLVHENNS